MISKIVKAFNRIRHPYVRAGRGEVVISRYVSPGEAHAILAWYGRKDGGSATPREGCEDSDINFNDCRALIEFETSDSVQQTIEYLTELKMYLESRGL